jgi:hypothetical protein
MASSNVKLFSLWIMVSCGAFGWQEIKEICEDVMPDWNSVSELILHHLSLWLK